MRKVAGKRTIACSALCVLLSLLLCFAAIGLNTQRAYALDGAGTKYTTDYDSLEKVRDAMSDLNKQIGAEGFVLLKNENNTLPLAKNSKVSLFGKNSVNPVLKGSGSSGSVGNGAIGIVESLKSEGFVLNPALEAFYKDNAVSGSVRPDTGFSSYNYNSYFPTAETPQTKYTSSVKDSYRDYADAAVVVFSRTGGEGTDLPRSSFVKPEDEGKVPSAANARAYPTREQIESGTWMPKGGEGRVKTPFAHYLELDENEIDLIDEVTKSFSKVIVVLNSNNAMELSREKLIDNAKVQSIIYAPGGGQNGFDAIGKILSGEVNPSGRLADTFAADFTLDPTWNNYANNNVGYYADGGAGNAYTTQEGIDYKNNFDNGVYEASYEEGIYVGYNYYETRGFVEGENWYENAVNYPFGYGLSYSDFEMKIVEASPADGASFAADEEITVKVKVTNTGLKAGKEVVQLYFSAPYTPGETEKSHVTLGAFAKTAILAAGASQTVELKLNAFDMASYDYLDKDADDQTGYELDKGIYNLYIGKNAHDAWAAASPLKTSLNLVADLNIDNDPTSTNAIENRFDEVSDQMQGKLMSRDDFETTYPTRPLWFDVENTTTVDPFWLAEMKVKYNNPAFKAGDNGETPVYLKKEAAQLVKSDVWLKNFDMPLVEGATAANAVIATWYDEANPRYENGKAPWFAQTAPAFRAESEAYSAGNPAPIQLKDMAGVALNNAKWDQFVNQLTINQAYSAIGTQFQFNAQAAIGAPAAGHSDGPLGLSGSWVGGGDSIIAPMGDGSSAMKFTFATPALVACTFNTVLAEEEGRLVGEMGLWTRTVGWYAPAANIHRSPFSGRNFEYYSESGELSAKMLSAVVKGARDKGMVTFMKHFALNDQETNRDTNGVATWADEQTMRQIYFKPFEEAVKVGGSNGAMSSFNRIGFDWAGANYSLLNELTRGEWGFKGVVITDAHGSGYGCMNANQMLRAGNDLSLDGKAGSIAAATNSAQANTPTQLKALQTALKNVYYTVLNSAAMRNGLRVDPIAYTAGTAYSSFSYAATDLGTVKPGAVASGLAVSDGDAEHPYIHVAGKLPDGLSVGRDGKISGTVAQNVKAGVYKFTVAKAPKEIGAGEQCYIGVTGKMASQNLRVFSVTVSYFPRETSKTAAVNQWFSADVSSKMFGDDARYSITNAPEGIVIDEALGIIHGKAATAGSYTISVKAASVTNGEFEYTFALNVGKTVYIGGELVSGYAGINYAASVADAKLDFIPAGTSFNATYALSAGSVLPEGLKLQSNGMITGSTDAAGDYTIKVTASISGYGQAEAVYTLRILPALSLEGDKGDKGDMGEKGETGANGVAGQDGKDADAVLGTVGTVMGGLGLLGGIAAIVLVLQKKKKV